MTLNPFKESQAPHNATSRCRCAGFTLFEMCIVLVLVAIFVGFVTAGLGSAFQEQALREDASKFNFYIRSAELRCQDENVPFIVTLTENTVSFRKAGTEPTDPDEDVDPLSKKDKSIPDDTTDGDQMTASFHQGNEVWMPDSNRLQPWAKVKEVSWVFVPGHLCPVTETVRWTRGESWIEERFEPLTGDLDHETYAFQ